jgi:hypothetical protein
VQVDLALQGGGSADYAIHGTTFST